MKILITRPSSKDIGGVSTFYTIILPHMEKRAEVAVSSLEIGSTHRSGGFLHPLSDQLRFRRRIREPGISLVVVNPSFRVKSFFRDALFILAALKRQLPVLVFFRGWDMRFAKRVEKYLMFFFRRTYGRAKGFIVLSDIVENALRQWRIAAPVYRMTTTVDENLVKGFSIGRHVEGIHRARTVKILFMARIETYKGIYEALEALRLLLERGYDVTMDIAGDGRERPAAEEFVRTDALLREHVVFHGYVAGEQKYALIRQQHLYCFPSYGEGMPSSVLETMACGLCVAGRRVGALQDFFMDAKMGYLTDSGDPEILADLMEKLMRDRPRMAEIARFNYEFIRSRFMPSQVADDMVRICRKACIR